MTVRILWRSEGTPASIRILSSVRNLGRVVRWSFFLAFTLWLADLVPRGGVIPEGPFLIAISAVTSLWFLLRGIRQICFLAICRLMIRSGISFLLRFGVWELLTVGVHFWPGGMPDYAGFAALHRMYDTLDAMKRYRMVKTIREFESKPCPVTKEAIMFLEFIESA